MSYLDGEGGRDEISKGQIRNGREKVETWGKGGNNEKTGLKRREKERERGVGEEWEQLERRKEKLWKLEWRKVIILLCNASLCLRDNVV